ncbi:hypothetical protein G3M53_47325, partial [Streptomyces sp. SID7982]|nr:hypothetical protein [Streptomyces sp. SID7982]
VKKSDTAFREGGFQGTPTVLLNGESVFPGKGDEQISPENLKKWVAEANKGKKPGSASPAEGSTTPSAPADGSAAPSGPAEGASTPVAPSSAAGS